MQGGEANDMGKQQQSVPQPSGSERNNQQFLVRTQVAGFRFTADWSIRVFLFHRDILIRSS
jgi:hypothetical protein